MPDAVTHPTPQELAAFGLGKLSERAAAAIAAHLESCPACRLAVANVPPDSFLGKVRAAGPDGSSFPPGLARPGNVPTSAGQPALLNVPCPDVPPELARHPKYLILRELGRGGMGVVYQARQTGMMVRQVVIKVINRSLIDQPAALERFRREVHAAGQLSHPNIVTAYDAEQAGDLHMLVMEFVPGQSLAEVLARKGPVSVVNACLYARQVALGLQHACERGMVHRDIKPGNLILMPKGQVKILDFGLAKVISERAASKGLTSSDAYMGTPEYCAPEQATDARTADIRADLYSLGCTLYCLLAGRPPFQEDTAIKTILAHLQKEPQPLPELRPDVPAELWQVVKRLLAKEPAQRYQKPIEVARALTVFVKPGAKTEVKASAAPAQDAGSPPKGTKIAADSNQIKKVLREVPGKAPPKQMLAKEETSPFENLEDTSAPPKAKGSRESGRRGLAKGYWRWAVLAGVGILLLVLAGMWAKGVIKVKTKDGTIVLENLPADAEVLVDGETVSLKAGDGKTITITAGKKHQLQVKQEGFKVFGKEVEIDAGEHRTIRVSLLPESKPPRPDPDEDKGFVPLFNGKDLSGWKVDGGSAEQWVADDNSIVGQSKHWSTRSYLLAEKDYSDFVLRFEFKVEEESHGGVAIRAIEGEKVPLNNLIFDHPIIKLTHPALKGREPTGTTNWIKSAAAYVAPVEVLPLTSGIWHLMKVIVRGESCTATVGGKNLVEVTLDPDARNNGGFIPGLGRPKGKVGFQINTGIVRFRKIEIKELPPPKPEDQGFVPLFNGKDLTGWKRWKRHPDDETKWEVKDGVLIGSGATSHLFSERGDYENFHFLIEAMINDGGISGQYFRTEFIPNFPEGYQAQINSTVSTATRTGSLIGLGTLVEVNEQLHKPDEWFTQEVIADGDHIVIKVNGKTVVDTHDKRYKKGHFALQVFDRNTVVKFRKVEVKELPPSKPEGQGFVPLFNGKDLDGWNPSPGSSWRVNESGVLIGSGSTSSGLFTERGDFADFHLRAEVMLGDGFNSRFLFRASGPTHYGVMIAGERGPNQFPWPTGSLFREDTGDKGLQIAPQVELQRGKWFKLEILAQGSHIKVFVDDVVVVDYTDPDDSRSQGAIGLTRRPRSVVKFRKLEIKELK